MQWKCLATQEHIARYWNGKPDRRKAGTPIQRGDYSGVADVLTQYGKDNGYASRRNAEANLLRQIQSSNSNTNN